MTVSARKCVQGLNGVVCVECVTAFPVKAAKLLAGIDSNV